LNLFESYPFHTFHVCANERCLTITAQGLKRKFACAWKEILIFEHMETELLTKKVLFTLSAGIHPDFPQDRIVY